jgi:outer membrane protein assembly factor BamE (lipoprotein component of BamABCDE complex)
MRVSILVVLVCLSLAACAGTPFEWENARQIHIGSSQADVVALLGKPYMVKTAGADQTWIWSYSGLDGTRLVSYGLRDGLVTIVPTIIN